MSNWMEDWQGDEGSVKGAIRKLKELEFEMAQAEAAWKEAKAKFEKYSRTTLVDAFTSAGIAEVTLDDGRIAKVVTTVRASVVKDKAENVARWLEEHDCGDIVTRTCAVPSSYASQLSSLNIPHSSICDMNTNSIKKVVGSLIEMGVIAQKDLPDGLGWFQYDEVKVK